jgi:hypothetical protein
MNNYFIELDLEAIAEASIAAVRNGSNTIPPVNPQPLKEQGND